MHCKLKMLNNMVKKVLKCVAYTIEFPHNFVIGFIDGWNKAKKEDYSISLPFYFILKINDFDMHLECFLIEIQ